MGSKLFFDLKSTRSQKYEGGSLTEVTSREVPGFVNISYSNLTLNKRGSLAPIWHPNAHKIGYCSQGKTLVSIRAPKGPEVFTVQAGEMFFIPQGYVHQIENIGDNDSIIHFALSNTNPEMMQMSKAVCSISDSVFNATFNTTTGFVDGLKKDKNDNLITVLPPLKNAPNSSANKYKFNLQGSDKAIVTKGGYLQIGTKATLPTLDGLGILGFGLNPKGIVEPHWHTNAGELVFIVKGKTRITVLAPDGSVDVLEVGAGQGAFAPASHFHNIENVGTENVEVIAFFSNADPDYIGIGEVVGAYSTDVLASVFKVAPSYFDTFKKPVGPLVIGPA